MRTMRERAFSTCGASWGRLRIWAPPTRVGGWGTGNKSVKLNMSKNISVTGTGYVGHVAAVGLADFGNTVIGCDLDASFSDFFEFIRKLYMLLELKTK
jgi:hypothetical protein